jgi:hypothetical protein
MDHELPMHVRSMGSTKKSSLTRSREERKVKTIFTGKHGSPDA